MNNKYTKRLVILMLTSLFIVGLFAQKQANWWYFGRNAGLNFNILSPATPSTGGQVQNMPEPVIGPMDTWEGCFTISNKSGDLLMSGDGSTIWNKNNVVMTNGSGMGGGNSSTQSGIIIPVPGSTTLYYAVSVAQDNGTNGVQYSTVDMSNGLGEVLLAGKNTSLLAGPTDENIAAVKKTNSENWWLIHRRQGGSSQVVIYVWEVTSAGIIFHNLYPFIGAFGSGITYVGVLKFSADGTRFISPNLTAQSVIFGEFDPLTGDPSNVDGMSFPTNGLGPYGAEFSPNGDLVYISANNGNAYQIPWSSIKSKTLSSRILIFNNLSNLQLAPDGRIYGVQDVSTSLSVILSPNTPGMGCDPRVFGGYLLNNAGLGLPTFAASFFSAEAENKAFICRDNDFKYRIEIAFSGVPADYPATLEWDWGDLSTPDVQNVTVGQTKYSMEHNYVTLGTYNLTITPYKSDSSPLDPIILEVNVVNCDLQVNRMIRVNVDNASTQLVKQ